MRSTASTPSLAQLFGAFALAALGTALLMATDLLLASHARGARGVAVAWNVLGILDMVDAVTLGALTTSGALPYPLVLIPAFGVPLSLILHSLSLRQLRRLGRRNVTGL